MTHHPECEDATGEYSGSCTCAIIKRREAMEHVIHSSMSIDFERRYAMDDLIAQDADLIDVEAVARALAKVDRIEICSDATYALSSYGYKARAAIAALRAEREQAAAEERAKIVAWLRKLAEEKGFLSVEDIEQALQETER